MPRLTPASKSAPVPKKNGRKQKQPSTEKEKAAIKEKLQRGESIRNDGQFMFRPTKKHYNGPEEVKPIYAPTLEELREKEIVLLSRLNAQLSVNDSKRTLNEEYELWRQLKQGVQNSTLSNYIYMYEHYVKPSKLGRYHLRLIKKSDVKAFYVNLMETTSIKINTMDNVQGVLYQIFNMAVEDRIIVANPADGALTEIRRNFADEDNTRVALTLAEQYMFLKCLEEDNDRRWLIIFTVLLLTGMRAGELCGLQWSDVDFDANVIHVRHNLVYFSHSSGNGKVGYDMHSPKSKAGRRDIPMFPRVRELLLEQKATQEEKNIRCKQRIDGFDDFVFMNRQQLPFHHSTLNSAIKRKILKHNAKVFEKTKNPSDDQLIPVFTCHVLRHTMATRLIENGVSPIAVKSILGHKTIKVTMDIYVSVTESFKASQMGMKPKKEYPDIFREQLRGEEAKQIAPILQKMLPESKEKELELLTQIYTDFVQNNPDFKVGYDNV